MEHHFRLDSFLLLLRNVYTEDRFQVARQTPRAKLRMDYFMLLLAAVSVGVFTYEMFAPAHPAWLDAVTIAFDCTFLADYILRTLFSGMRRRARWRFRLAKNNYLARWYGIVDLLSVVPPFLAHVFHVGFSVEEFSRISRVLRMARAARILRLLRGFRVVRDSQKLSKHVAVFHGAISTELRAALILMVSALTIGGFLLYELEGSTNAHFRSAGEILYWSVLSLMGQSDASMFVTVYARIVGVGVIFCGVAFLGLVSGSISAFFIDKINKRMSGKMSHTYARHVVICGWNSRVPELLDHLSRVQNLEHAVIVTEVEDAQALQDHSECYRNPHLGSHLQVEWINGSPRDEAVLLRSGIQDAEKVIVMADATGLDDETDVDARTLITVHAIYDCLDSEQATVHTGREHRNLEGDARVAIGGDTVAEAPRPKITVEVLSQQTVRIINNMRDSRKVDHVVYADEIVCQYITIDVDSRAAIDVYRQLFEPTDQNVYLQRAVFLSAVAGIEDLLEGIERALKGRGCVFLGIRIHASQVLRRLVGTGDGAVLKDLLEGAGLAKETDAIVHGHCNLSLQEAVDAPARIHDAYADDLERRERAGRSDDGLLILNPWARRELCRVLLSDRLATLRDHAPFHLAVMTARNAGDVVIGATE